MKLFNWKLLAFAKIPTNLRHRDVVCYGIILIACFLFFQQTDLYYTSASSYAYLNGHFLDLYDYNKPIFGGSDYLPMLYAILALWNLPLKIFGLTTDVSMVQAWMGLSIVEIIWTKLLLVLFFYATAIMTYKTAEVITKGAHDQAKLAAGLFITAPIAIFSVFIFGQYDIIGLFFTMAGFYYYVRKQFTRFAWFFSIAISFKFFPIAIFIPLVLLAEKRLFHLVKFGVIGVTATALQILLYWNNNSFRDGIFLQAAGKVTHVATLGLSPLNNGPIILVAYFIICLYTYIKEPESDTEWWKIATLTAIAAYATMFSTIIWHPQWLVIIIPFFSLAALFIKDKSRSYVIDIIGMLSFVWVVVNIWANGVDVSMLHYGAFRKFFENFLLINADLMPVRFMAIFQALFFVYLFSPLLIIALQRSNDCLIYDGGRDNRVFRSRFVLGIAVFIIPSLFCVFVPMSIALKIKPELHLLDLKPGLVLDRPGKPTGEVLAGDTVTQSFKADRDKLAAVSVQFATYARVNSCSVKLALLAKDGTEIATQTIRGRDLLDNVFYLFRFPAIGGSAGRVFQIQISSPDGKQGNAITVYMNESDIYPDGQLAVNGIAMPGDLLIKLYYEH